MCLEENSEGVLWSNTPSGGTDLKPCPHEGIGELNRRKTIDQDNIINKMNAFLLFGCMRYAKFKAKDEIAKCPERVFSIMAQKMKKKNVCKLW